MRPDFLRMINDRIEHHAGLVLLYVAGVVTVALVCALFGLEIHIG